MSAESHDTRSGPSPKPKPQDAFAQTPKPQQVPPNQAVPGVHPTPRPDGRDAPPPLQQRRN